MDIKPVLNLTPSRLQLLRHRLAKHNVTEEYLTDALTKLGCRLVRPRMIMPAIIEDRKHRRYDEHSYSRLYFSHVIAKKYGYDYRKEMAKILRGNFVDRVLFKHLLKSRRAWIVYDRMIIDSVWSYEPLELVMDRDRVIQVQGMLARSIPFENKVDGLLVYKRKAPRLKPPKEDESESV